MSELLAPPPQVSPAAVRAEAGPARFEAFFHASPHGILIVDDSGTILEANEQAGTMVGYRPDSLPGSKAIQFLDPSTAEKVNQAFLQTQLSGQAYVETRIIRSDGTAFPAEIFWNRLRSDGRIFFHASITDITRRCEALEESKRATEQAEQANEARLLFLATMSHEIRTPLNGIIGFSHLLAESELSTIQQQYVDMVGRSGDILLRIIDDILHLSRIESGRFELEEIEFSPVACIEDVFEMHANSSKLASVELHYEILDGVPPLVRGDITRIRQILTNLVSNALKFTAEGHILVRCAVQGDRFLAFSVRDTGLGFDPSKTENLFMPFVQEDATTTQKFGGTGLGLAICRKLVDRMGGYIEARSQPGQGAEFWFGIPLLPSSNGETPPRPLAGHRALLIGGSELGSRLLGKRIATTGLELHVERDAQTALTLLKKNTFPLIIVADHGGRIPLEELGDRIRKLKNNRKSALLLLTSATSPPDQGSAASSGYRAVLRTPFRHGDLEAAILPLLRPASSESAVDPFANKAPTLPPPPLASPESKPFILIAEDNHINAQLALLVTQRLGFQAHLAHNGREVLGYLTSSQTYSAILMDMRMPGMDGIEATRRIRLGHAGVPVTNVPIYALTANAMDSDRKACLEVGMNGYFTKPLRIKEIEAAFREQGILPGA